MNVIRTIHESKKAFDNIYFYSNVFKEKPGDILFKLTHHIINKIGSEKNEGLWTDFFVELISWAETSKKPPVGNLWQNYLLDCIIASDNPFTRMASYQSPKHELFNIIKSAVIIDFIILNSLIDLDFNLYLPANNSHYPHLELLKQTLEWNCPESKGLSSKYRIFTVKKALLSNPDPEFWYDTLLKFHKECGNGLFCEHHALRWDGRKKELVGIYAQDPISFDNLVGYENERKEVITNTQRLISGLPASNILLYGDRGTGKSSTVKAVLNEFGCMGLRMIELPKAYLQDYPLIISAIRESTLKYIIFLDDLSFEEHDEDYKILKSMLEGSLQAIPTNVAIYATSNRRHLIREYFDDRRSEIGLDTLQEKLSLSDRFGITVFFPSPDQGLYLQIVEKLAQQEGIDLPPETLRQKALEWELWHNSRSGRSARQFIDSLL